MKELIEKRLKSYIASQDCSLFEAAKYALSLDSERLYSQLLIASGQTFGKDAEQLIDVACAVEMLFASCLIFQDYCTKETTSASKPSVKSVFGNQISILAANFLFNYSLQIISKDTHFSSDIKTEIIQTISAKLGSGWIYAQLQKIENVEEEEIDEPLFGNTLRSITQTAFKVGAIIAGCNNFQLDDLASEIATALEIQKLLQKYPSSHLEPAEQNKPCKNFSDLELQKLEEKYLSHQRTIFSKLQTLPRSAPKIFSILQKIFQTIS